MKVTGPQLTAKVLYKILRARRSQYLSAFQFFLTEFRITTISQYFFIFIFMPFRCFPSDPPDDWAQLHAEDRQDVVIIYINAGDFWSPHWLSAVFDLEVFRKSRGHEKVVHVAEADGFHSFSLAAWVSDCKPTLRGNARGAIYYDRATGWQRLLVLLERIVQVHIPIPRSSLMVL